MQIADMGGQSWHPPKNVNIPLLNQYKLRLMCGKLSEIKKNEALNIFQLLVTSFMFHNSLQL